jgi:hypothetical protein
MGTKKRKKEIIKEKMFYLLALLYTSLYLFDEGKVNYLKSGALLFAISTLAFGILKNDKGYIDSGRKISIKIFDLYRMFEFNHPNIVTYNAILATMMFIAWFISLCLVAFGIYLKFKLFL